MFSLSEAKGRSVCSSSSAIRLQEDSIGATQEIAALQRKCDGLSHELDTVRAQQRTELAEEVTPEPVNVVPTSFHKFVSGAS